MLTLANFVYYGKTLTSKRVVDDLANNYIRNNFFNRINIPYSYQVTYYTIHYLPKAKIKLCGNPLYFLIGLFRDALT